MIEARIRQLSHPLLRETDAGGDEIRIEPDLGAMGDDLDEIAPRRRLAAGKMRVKNAHGGGFGKDPQPSLRIELAGA